MVQARLGLASPPQPADAADAAALALCHLAHGPDAARRAWPGRREGGRVIGSLRGAVLERGLDGDGAARGRRRRLPRRRSRRGRCAELEPTTTVFLHVHHHIREDGQTLYGFLGRDERATFEALIATHGVGPALAMAILATHPPAALVDIVASGDVAALTLVPGVGKKTAERLLVELKNRLSIRRCSTPIGGGGGGGSVRRRRARGAGRPRLRARGDPRGAARAARPTATRPTLLRDALKLLGARRA